MAKTTTAKRLAKEIFQLGRQNSSWTPMPTLKNNANGCPVDSNMNTWTNRCSSMPLQLAGVNMTMVSAGARENHCPNKTWGAEPTTMELIHPNSTQEDIKDL